MDIHHYCYTRGNYLDYGDFSYSMSISSKEQESLLGIILSVIDDIDCNLSIPKWILIKSNKTIIWGCCCWNKLLAKTNYCDRSGTPVSGFFAVVITDYTHSSLKLPFDIEYFRKLYSLEVEPYWNKEEQHKNNTIGFIQGEFNYVYGAANGSSRLLNTDIFRCKSLGNVNREDVLSAALMLDNISLLIDNDNIEQAINKNGPFMNNLSANVPTGEYSVKRKCPKCGKFVSAFADGNICVDCKEEEAIRIINIKKDEEMDRKLKDDLDVANRKIGDLESIIESDKASLKKKGLIVKILSGVIVVLLLALAYAHRDKLSFNIFGTGRHYGTEQHINTLPNDMSHYYFRTHKSLIDIDKKSC